MALRWSAILKTWVIRPVPAAVAGAAKLAQAERSETGLHIVVGAHFAHDHVLDGRGVFCGVFGSTVFGGVLSARHDSIVAPTITDPRGQRWCGW